MDKPLERKVPERKPGEVVQAPKTHEWTIGTPLVEGIQSIRYDSCQKCGCIRRMILRVGMHPWTDGYTLNGSKTVKAPTCNK